MDLLKIKTAFIRLKDSWKTSEVGLALRKRHGYLVGFPGGSAVKNLPAKWETQVWSLSQEDPLEKGRATHSSILAWRIP